MLRLDLSLRALGYHVDLVRLGRTEIGQLQLAPFQHTFRYAESFLLVLLEKSLVLLRLLD